MNVINEVGKIGLEGLMERANIVFSNGYSFKGIIDEACFAQSIKAICHSIYKFNYKVNFATQNNYTWGVASQRQYQLHSIISTDLDHGFAQLCENIFTVFDLPNSEPMLFNIIKNDLDDEFIIAQSCNHIYVDARSAEVIFNHIVNHYNALCSQSPSTANAITLKAKALRTLPADSVIEECFKENPQANHDENVAKIIDYPIYDFGKHVIPLSTLDKALVDYRKKPRAPLIQHFNVEDIIKYCRQKNANISKNSVVCAVIAKAIYNINVQEKAVNTNHTISFKMLSDILSPNMRQKYSGNYIAFVPVSVRGEKSLEDMANDIHHRVVDFKKNDLDTSVFALTEAAVNNALVGTADDPLSFVVTNWNNFSFIDTERFLTNCHSVKHQSGVNINPKDTLGAALVNRPVLVINFSPKGELCISQFPSLSSQAVNDNLSEHLKAVFLQQEII